MGRPEDIYERVKQLHETAIDEFIVARQSEELFLDFKRSADSGKGMGGKVIHSTDRNNLAKAISGFGNSEGGVVVWGVDASVDVDFADVAKTKKPIKNIKRFVSWLEGAISGCTVPAHIGVEHYGIDTGSGNGFVATYIPKSEIAPHQCVFDSRYYMRAGSSFLPVPHAVLAGMFGRRPQPTIFCNFAYEPARITRLLDETDAIKLSIGFQIYNKGPVLARHLYSDLRLMLPKAKCHASFEPDNEDWSARMDYGMWLSLVSKEEFRLAPESFVRPFVLNITLGPPFVQGQFWVKWTFGCDGSPIQLRELKHDYTDVERLYRGFLENPPTDESGYKFIKDLFNFSEKS